MFRKNVDMTKMEVKVRMEKFLAMAFKKFYISIWSCMKFEDLLKILPMFMLSCFWINSFSFRDIVSHTNITMCGSFNF
jgi:hypothetical protein